MRKIVSVVLVVALAVGIVALNVGPAEAGKGGGKPGGKDCSKKCPPVGECVAVACGSDCVYECPFPPIPPS